MLLYIFVQKKLNIVISLLMGDYGPVLKASVAVCLKPWMSVMMLNGPFLSFIEEQIFTHPSE
jgi:hypothetical protein